MATYDLKYPGAAIDTILDTAYDLQNAGYIFRGLASEYSNTPTERSWVLAGEGETGHGFTSPVPKGYIGVCVFNGTSWTGKLLKCVSIDSTPTSGSTNAVSSGGAYASISQLADTVNEALDNLTFTDTTPSAFLGEYITEKVSTTDGGLERILTYFTILSATASKAGLLSAADKAKLDALWSSGYQFAGIATPSTIPVSTTSKIFYIATEAGTYFNAVTVTKGINILSWNGSAWSAVQVVGIDDEPTADSPNLPESGGVFGELALGAVYDVSAKNPTAGPNSDGKWESLSALLSDANLNTLIPTSVRKGGMSIKYVQSSDNKYVQHRLTSNIFSSDVKKWQGIDIEPTNGSHNIPESGGVYKTTYNTILNDGLIEVPYSIIDGLRALDSSQNYVLAESYTTYVIPVMKGCAYSFGFGKNLSDTRKNCGWSTEYPQRDVSAEVYATETSDIFQNNVYIAPYDGYFGLSIQLRGEHLDNLAFYMLSKGSIQTVDNKLTGLIASKKAYFDDTIVDFRIPCFLEAGKYYKLILNDEVAALGMSVYGYNEDVESWRFYNIQDNNWVILAPSTIDVLRLRRNTVNYTGEAFCRIYDYVKYTNIAQIPVFDSFKKSSLNFNNAQKTASVVADTRIDFYIEGLTILEGAKLTFEITSGWNELGVGDYDLYAYKNSELVGTIVSRHMLPFYSFIAQFDFDSIRVRSRGYYPVFSGEVTAKISEYTYTPEIAYKYAMPKRIFSISNLADVNNNIIQQIPVEGLVEEIYCLKANRGRSVVINPYLSTVVNTQSIEKTIEISGDGYKTCNGTFSHIITNAEVLLGKNIRWLTIGDSYTNRHENSYSAYLAERIKKISVDLEQNLSVLEIGTIDGSTSLEYKGNNYDIRSKYEGRGGWSTCTYLFHPVLVREGAIGTFNRVDAWDAAGLGRKIPINTAYDDSLPYTNYTGTANQTWEYMTTPWGYYHWDYTENLYIKLGGTGTYSGTSEQKAFIDTKMNVILDNPTNPFYDRTTVLSTDGRWAFSLNKYLERYKTLDNDGVTRLIVGSTAGTEITSSTINSYDVCLPTHITFVLGQNDFRGGGCTGNTLAELHERLANAVHSEYPNIIVGIGRTHQPGAYNPNDWADSNICVGKFSLSPAEQLNECAFSANKVLSEKYGLSNSKTMYVPTYFIQGILNDKVEELSDVSGNKWVCSGEDAVHPSYNSLREYGEQILAWLAYTETIE